MFDFEITFETTEDEDTDLAISVAVANAVREKWVEIASSELHATRQAYLESISPVRVEGERAAIELRADSEEGWLANAIEHGAPSWDMKQDFTPTGVTEDGALYARVKFTYGGERGNPKKGLRALGRPYGRTGEAEADRVGRRVRRELGKAGGGPLKPGQVGLPSMKPTHKTDIYAGLTRSPGQIGVASLYRTLSENSDPDSWIHPGFEPHDFLERAVQETDVDTIAAAIRSGLTKE